MFSLIGVGGFLPSTMGYTVKGSSNGSTAAMDGTNRITAASNWGTNANSSSAAISWIVLTDGAGIDWCFAYNSASADIVRLSHSPGGNYTTAGTATFQPTATDEIFDAASGTWVQTGTSLDRVWHMWGSSDKKMFRAAVYRNGTLGYIAGEKFTSAIVSPATLTLASGGGVNGALKIYINAQTLNSWISGYVAATTGGLTRAHSYGADNNIKTQAGGESAAAVANFFGFERPGLQGGLGDLIFPVQWYCLTGGSDGKLGSAVDMWYVYTNSNSVPNTGDVFGSNQFMSLGGGGPLLPLDGATTPVTS